MVNSYNIIKYLYIFFVENKTGISNYYNDYELLSYKHIRVIRNKLKKILYVGFM